MLRRYTRVSARAAHYTPAGGIEKCGACRFYMPPAFCGRLTDPVSPQGWCRFFSREMVQRWQPGTPGMGGSAIPPGASLDLDFTTPGTLDPRISFTRAAGPATYFDSSGVMRTAAVNAPRWDYDPATHALKGLLIEEARTNLMPWSADASVWSALGSGAAAPTVTANQVAAPDGTLTAARVVYPAVSAGGAFSLVYEQFGVTAAPYAFSVWLRGSVGGEQVYIGSNGTVYYSAARITLTTAWQRFVLVTPALTAASWFFDVGTDLRDGSQASTPAQTIYVWGAQVEAGAFATSYIPTTAAAVTRAADVATMPTAAWFSGTTMSAAMEATVLGVNSFATLFALNDGTTNNRLHELVQASNNYASSLVASGGTFAVAFPETTAITLGTPFKFGATLQAGQFQSALNGAVPYSSTTGIVLPIGMNALNIGNFTGIQALNGYARRLRYWPRVLSVAELQSVTT